MWVDSSGEDWGVLWEGSGSSFDVRAKNWISC